MTVPDWSRMTLEEKRALVANKVARERTDQGLPPRIEDPAVLERVATILRHARRYPGAA